MDGPLAVDTYQLLSCFADLEPKIAFSRVRKRSYCNCVFAIGPCQNRPARPAVKVAAAWRRQLARPIQSLAVLIWGSSFFAQAHFAQAASLGIVLQNFILRVGYQLCNCCEKNAKLHWARQSSGGSGGGGGGQPTFKVTCTTVHLRQTAGSISFLGVAIQKRFFFTIL